MVVSGILGNPAEVVERLDTHVVDMYHENDPVRRIERVPLRTFLDQLHSDSFDGAIYEERIDTERVCHDNPDVMTLFGAPADDAVTLMFFSHSGGYAHLHHDFDGRFVLLTQLVGVKRVLMLPPTRTRPIPAMEGPRSHWSTIYLEHLRPGGTLRICGFHGRVRHSA